MLKSSHWIRKQSLKHRLIEPFVSESVRRGVISYGLGPYGYDLRLSSNHKRLRKGITLLDPHQVKETDYETLSSQSIIVEPGNYILGQSVEYFRLPKKIMGLVFGKSTYARCGIVVNVTPLEPEWSGYLTISISNTSAVPVALYPGEGIAQVVFLGSDDFPIFSYKDLKGKYNDEQGIAISRIQQT